jgi:PAS domain S-box-containing protein
VVKRDDSGVAVEDEAPVSQGGERLDYELLVQAVVDYAIYMLDPEGRVTSWNAGARRIKGYEASEVLGQSFARFYTDEDRATGLPQKALKIAEAEGRYVAEGWRQRKDGTRLWASVVIDPIRDKTGRLLGFAKVTRDMTEHHQSQQRLEEAREQLLQSQKMEALGQLTGGLAHDFNNLLTAVISGAELALRNINDPVRVKPLLEGVRAAAQRGGGLTRQLLAFARRQPLETSVVEVKTQLVETIALARHSISPEIELISEISDPLSRVATDAGQLELAVMNLMFNARDAMGEDGGVLRVSARNVTMTGEIEGLVGDFVCITVSDTGTGIPPELMSRVIEPFFTTKAFGQGTGLGLSQVFGFARQAGGALTLQSKVGEGTGANLYLPAIDGRIVERTHAARGRVILVVEDDPTVAELASAMLEDFGYDPRVASSGRQALDMLNAQPDIAMVFSDVIMPGGISGLELARKIRMRRPELPILLTTGYSEAATDSQEFPLIAKPYEFESLKAAIAAQVAPDRG